MLGMCFSGVTVAALFFRSVRWSGGNWYGLHRGQIDLHFDLDLGGWSYVQEHSTEIRVEH